MRLALRTPIAALVVFAASAASAAIINLSASLDGLQEVPPNASPATGTATCVMDTDANTLTYTVAFSGLLAPQTAGHFHGFAAPGVNAGVLHGLPALGSPVAGVWNYLEAQEANIIAGLTYVNIHTSMFPGGEIRGQVVREVVGVEDATMSRVRNLYR